MATITTEYAVGDVVFHAGTATEVKQHPCPDCNGGRKWKAISPAGNEYTFACPRCSTSYSAHHELNLKYSAHVASVSKLTIGSVRYNSCDGYDHGAQYMCVETGVGGGRVYKEADLFRTKDEAQRAAEVIAIHANGTVQSIVERYNQSLEISDYQLENAAMKKAKDYKSRAGSILWNINDLFATIEEATDKDAILEAVDEYKRHYWERDLKSAELPEPATTTEKLGRAL